VATVILLRHARSSANSSGVLAGRTPGVGLDEKGRAQAQALARRLVPVPLAAVVTSPLQRCRQTVGPLLAERGLEVTLASKVTSADPLPA